MTKPDDTVQEIVEQGKTILQKANTRHIIIRKANGEKLVDVTLGIAVAVALLMLWFQPFGMLLGLAGLAYGLYAKLRMEVVRESSSSDNVIEMRVPSDDDQPQS
jgi:hypothetical protein